MNVSSLISSGWLQFSAILIIAAIIILAVVYGRGDRYVASDGSVHLRIYQTWLYNIAMIWLVFHIFLSEALIEKTPLILIAPGMDLALFLAYMVVLVRRLTINRALELNWGSALGKIWYFMMPGLLAVLVYKDVTLIPIRSWIIPGIEAAILLPFFIKWGYEG